MQNPRSVKIAKVDLFICDTVVKFEFLILDNFCICLLLLQFSRYFLWDLGKSGSKQEGF